MANTPVAILDDTMTDIADAIRGKNGSQDTYKPSEMPAAITAIPAGGGGIPREVNASGVYGWPTENFTFSLPAGATDVAEKALYQAFDGCKTIVAANLSSLTTISTHQTFYTAFRSCTSLTSVDISSLVSISGSTTFDTAFRGCTSLTSFSASSLTTITGSSAFPTSFYGCTALASVDFSSLVTVGPLASYAFASAFYGCTALTSADFSSLATISGGVIFQNAFRGCTSLTSLSFPALTTSSFGSYTNQFDNMLQGVTGCTVHFPSAIQSTIGSWSSVTGGFGGTNTTVLFDL